MMTNTATTAEPASTVQRNPCPPWCVQDTRTDRTTEPNCHPEDFATWHDGQRAAVDVERHLGRYKLNAALRFWDPDLVDPDHDGPEIRLEGDDGSGDLCGFLLPVDAAERLALVMLELVKAARA